MSELAPFLRHVVAELKRRRVFRVAAAYAAVAFIVAQAADIAFPALRLPEWSMTLLVVLLLLGFPFALVLAWIFDVTPGGLVRTADASGAQPPATARTAGTPRAAAVAAVGGTLVLAVAVGAFVLRGEPAADPVGELSVAVLPFSNQSSEADSEYFSDGLTEAIQTRLNRIEDLRVTSITSVMTYKATTKRMQEIAAELGVDHVVEGSVRRSGGRMRVSARLIEAATDRTLWSDTFERGVEDILAVESELAEQIAYGLRLRLSPSQRGRVAASGTNSVVAYDLYLRARKLLRETIVLDWAEERSSFYSAVALLRQALDADPGYAAAWAELSELYRGHIDLGLSASTDSARAMAERAIRLAPELPDGYVALGALLRRMQDEVGAARQFELALQRDPNHVAALLAYAGLARDRLDLLEQARLAHRAAQLAPTDPAPASMLGTIMLTLGDYAAAERWWLHEVSLRRNVPDWLVECWRGQLRAVAGDERAAAEHLRRFLAQAPDVAAAWGCAAGIQKDIGDYAAALPNAERVLREVSALPAVDGMPPEEVWGSWHLIGGLLVELGDTVRAHAMLADAERANLKFRESCPRTCRNTPLAELYAYRGDADRAVEFLEHSIRVGWIGIYPGSPGVRRAFRNISHDPRYQKLMGDLIADFDRQREQVRREGLDRP